MDTSDGMFLVVGMAIGAFLMSLRTGEAVYIARAWMAKQENKNDGII